MYFTNTIGTIVFSKQTNKLFVLITQNNTQLRNQVYVYVLYILTTNFAAVIAVVTTGGKIFLCLCRSVTQLA